MSRQSFPAQEAPSSPDVLAFDSGKYRVIARLGQGGMADVFLAVSRGPLGVLKLVVIKRIRDELANDNLHCDMFLDEARLATRLNHPNVVQTYEASTEGSSHQLTMEYLEGQPLHRLLRDLTRRGRKMPPTLAAYIAAEALAGLQYAHTLTDYDGSPLHIVHRDVSPQNVFLTYEGRVKLVDFGIAKAERTSTKTQAGTFKGKAAYTAPEQLFGDDIDHRVDIFTTGIVLWEMLTGRRLMYAETTAKTLMRVLQEDIPRVSQICEVDPLLDAIVERALARDREARFASAREMRDALMVAIAASGAQEAALEALLEEFFAERRAKTRARIQEQMVALATRAQPPDESAPRISDVPSISRVYLSGPPSGSGLANLELTAARRSSLPVSVSAAPASSAPAPRRHPWLAATMAMACLSLGVSTAATWYLARHRLWSPTAASASPAPISLETATGAGAAPSPATPPPPAEDLESVVAPGIASAAMPQRAPARAAEAGPSEARPPRPEARPPHASPARTVPNAAVPPPTLPSYPLLSLPAPGAERAPGPAPSSAPLPGRRIRTDL